MVDTWWTLLSLCLFIHTYHEFLALGTSRWLHVWQVKLEGGCSLAADRMVSIPAPFYPSQKGRDRITLDQHLLVRAASLQNDQSWVEIYWWKQCSATRVLRSIFSMTRTPVSQRRLSIRFLELNPDSERHLCDWRQNFEHPLPGES